jgi:hypothetical protein
MIRSYAQPCANHEYIEQGCPDCGWLAYEDTEVFVCSNSACRTAWDADPHGHCPKCDRTANYPAPGSVGFSTNALKVESLAQFRARASQ